MPMRGSVFPVFLTVLLFAMASLSLPASAQEDVIGAILEVEGTVRVARADGGVVPAEIDMPLYLEDTIETGPQSRVFLLLSDNTEFTLSENARFRVDAFVFDGEGAMGNRGDYSVLQGAFLYVSGLIAKKENPDVRVNTPVGNIGIRGTTFWGGEIDGSYGILVNEGRVRVRNEAGEVTLASGEGTSIRGRRAVPDAPKRWGEDKIRRATATVFLKRMQDVRARVEKKRAQFKARHGRLRQKLQDLRGAGPGESPLFRNRNKDGFRKQLGLPAGGNP